jgi:hypothetical protein
MKEEHKCKCGSDMYYEPEGTIVTPVVGNCYSIGEWFCEKCKNCIFDFKNKQ